MSSILSSSEDYSLSNSMSSNGLTKIETGRLNSRKVEIIELNICNLSSKINNIGRSGADDKEILKIILEINSLLSSLKTCGSFYEELRGKIKQKTLGLEGILKEFGKESLSSELRNVEFQLRHLGE